MKNIILSLLVVITFTSCESLSTIPYPEQTPETWCETHPCVNVDLGFVQFTLNEPSSSLFVYALGLFTLWVAFRIFRKRDKQNSKLWFAIALLFWGIAAISAGTSYQAFSYEIKCAGRPFCSWTSWWEIYYYMFQSFSMNAFVVAVAYSSTAKNVRKYLFAYAFINAVVYNIILFTGAFLPDKFMVSFELFTLISAPNFIILFIINLSNYLKYKNILDFNLLWLWVLQGVIIIIYYAYWLSGIENMLWTKGIWFNANDVLHILIIGWQWYIYKYVADKINDSSAH